MEEWEKMKGERRVEGKKGRGERRMKRKRKEVRNEWMVEWEKMRGKGRVRGRKEGEKGEKGEWIRI
jgi:hypothetical protein